MIEEDFFFYFFIHFSGEPSFGKLIDEYLHDFDIFHLAHASELLHYIDPKYLSVELGGNRPVEMDTWMVVQQNVDAFTLRWILIIDCQRKHIIYYGCFYTYDSFDS